MSASNLLSDRHYGFWKCRYVGAVLAFIFNFWLSSLSSSGETFAVALDMSKTLDIVWHKSLLYKLLLRILSFALYFHI